MGVHSYLVLPLWAVGHSCCSPSWGKLRQGCVGQSNLWHSLSQRALLRCRWLLPVVSSDNEGAHVSVACDAATICSGSCCVYTCFPGSVFWICHDCPLAFPISLMEHIMCFGMLGPRECFQSIQHRRHVFVAPNMMHN